MNHLAKLTPKISSAYHHVIHDTSGKGITQGDVAWAMVGLGLGPYGLCRLVMLREIDTYHQLVTEWAVSVLQRHQWRIKTPHRLEKLARLAIYELMKDSRCPKCHGVDRPTPCRRCDGVGYIYMSQRARAREADIAISHWLAVWQKRYEGHIYSWLSTELQAAVRHIHRNLPKESHNNL